VRKRKSPKDGAEKKENGTHEKNRKKFRNAMSKPREKKRKTEPGRGA